MLNFFDGTFLVVVITRDVAQHVFFIFGFILYLKDGGWDGMGWEGGEKYVLLLSKR